MFVKFSMISLIDCVIPDYLSPILNTNLATNISLPLRQESVRLQCVDENMKKLDVFLFFLFIIKITPKTLFELYIFCMIREAFIFLRFRAKWGVKKKFLCIFASFRRYTKKSVKGVRPPPPVWIFTLIFFFLFDPFP